MQKNTILYSVLCIVYIGLHSRTVENMGENDNHQIQNIGYPKREKRKEAGHKKHQLHL